MSERKESKYVTKVAETLIEQMENGTAPWQRPWEPGRRFAPHNPVTGREYHGINVIWLLAQATRRGYEDARWMTAQQAEALAARPRVGERGAQVEYWQWSVLRRATDAEGRPKLDADGRQLIERVKSEKPRVFTAVVFNAEQLVGLPPAVPRDGAPAWERHERAEAVLKASGAAIRWQGDRAYYDWGMDGITLPPKAQFPSADGYYATALHELGHWTGHESRLARTVSWDRNSEAYAREELRAEIASLMLGDRLAIGHSPDQHASYVASWISLLRNEPREVFRAAADAERIVEYVHAFDRARAQGEPMTERGGHAAQATSAMTSGVSANPRIVVRSACGEESLEGALPKLEGSPKQVGWATRLRGEAVKDALIRLVNTPERAAQWPQSPYREPFLRALATEASQHVEARWWIDMREKRRLLESIAVVALGRPSEAEALEAMRAFGAKGQGTLRAATLDDVPAWLAEPKATSGRKLVVFRPCAVDSFFAEHGGAIVQALYDPQRLKDVEPAARPYRLPDTPAAELLAAGRPGMARTAKAMADAIKNLEHSLELARSRPSDGENRAAERPRGWEMVAGGVER